MSTVAETEINALREKIVSALLPYGVSRIALFGSIVRDEATPESDIDILVTLKPSHERSPIGLKWFGLADDLSRSLGRPVDLVTDEGLSPHIRPYVEQEMIIIYEA